MSELSSFSAADAPALAAAHALSFDRPWSADEFVDLLATPGVFALGVVAESRGDSFILCRALVGEAEILTLAVAPASRRAGLGRTLVEAAMGLATLAGAETCFLEVAADNTAALALYRSTGFETAGLRPGYYRRPDGEVDALVMRRDLNSAASAPYADGE